MEVQAFIQRIYRTWMFKLMFSESSYTPYFKDADEAKTLTKALMTPRRDQDAGDVTSSQRQDAK